MERSRAEKVVLICFTTISLAVLVALLSHKSAYPVFLGRYSLSLTILICTLILFYSCFLYLYFRGVAKLAQVYSFVSTTIVSTILLFLLLNVFAHVMNFAIGKLQYRFATFPDEHMQDKIRTHAALVGLDTDELNILKKERRDRAWEYEPWLGFKERPRQGKYVNVSKQGFRKVAGASTDARHTIFMFGGSTSFGYNVTDGQTISSFLQQKINDFYGPRAFLVRNYGRAYYYSSQEFILLWQLLKQGDIPDVAIFLDYLNELQSNPHYTEEMRQLFERSQKQPVDILNELGSFLGYGLQHLPIYRLIHGNSDKPTIRKTEYLSPEKVVHRYTFNNKNIQSMCAEHNISPFFFIGPVPGFRNNFETHLFRDEPLSEVYKDYREVMERLASLARDDPSITDLSGILECYRKQPFVDNIHYAPEVNELIAARMLEKIWPTLRSIHNGDTTKHSCLVRTGEAS